MQLSAHDWFSFFWMPRVHPLWIRKLSAMPIDSPVAVAHLALDHLEHVDQEFAELSDASWVTAPVEAIGVLAERAGFAAYLACPSVTRSVERTKQLLNGLSEQTLETRRQAARAFLLPQGISVPDHQVPDLDPPALGASMLIHASGFLGAAVQERVKLKLLPVPDAWVKAGKLGDAGTMCSWLEELHNANCA
jgi:hypothetical protein